MTDTRNSLNVLSSRDLRRRQRSFGRAVATCQGTMSRRLAGGLSRFDSRLLRCLMTGAIDSEDCYVHIWTLISPYWQIIRLGSELHGDVDDLAIGLWLAGLSTARPRTGTVNTRPLPRPLRLRRHVYPSLSANFSSPGRIAWGASPIDSSTENTRTSMERGHAPPQSSKSKGELTGCPVSLWTKSRQ